MRKKVTYIAFDGKEFDTEMKCCEYEENNRGLIKVRKAIDTIRNYCEKNSCSDCPFFNGGCIFTGDTPNDWEV